MYEFSSPKFKIESIFTFLTYRLMIENKPYQDNTVKEHPFLPHFFWHVYKFGNRNYIS